MYLFYIKTSWNHIQGCTPTGFDITQKLQVSALQDWSDSCWELLTTKWQCPDLVNCSHQIRDEKAEVNITHYSNKASQFHKGITKTPCGCWWTRLVSWRLGFNNMLLDIYVSECIDNSLTSKINNMWETSTPGSASTRNCTKKTYRIRFLMQSKKIPQ